MTEKTIERQIEEIQAKTRSKAHDQREICFYKGKACSQDFPKPRLSSDLLKQTKTIKKLFVSYDPKILVSFHRMPVYFFWGGGGCR